MMYGKFFLLSDLILEWCDDDNQFKNKIQKKEWITGPIPNYWFFISLKYFSELPESEEKTKLC